YEHQDDVIKFNIYNHNSKEILSEDDKQVALSDISSLYIDTLFPLFKVIALDNRYMTLEYNDNRYYLKKLN
ncbi:MAG: hypothetical protein IKK16_03495, partial [Bacteroidaceae bacterium]|nr:hypothetical protein [Bacteroidaceae bacterium]